ncbi:hypothetical protein L210DRAFT_981396 [Boletus edulis BED1]|uniref:Uncharacterized protein n=1 Tax=Boletus edulis BED1 TaxID=1328754 RepID=A0AAD4BMS8_BOLED|nr:hypothetical protein L210DRAFT_981396 [Boletus edulis BED1]
MAPKKRTDQSKHMPPTSTSHEVHHRLRHTGPSISTRSSASAAPSKPPHPPAHPEPTSESTPTEESSREKKSLAQVSPPGARTPLTKFLHVLLVLVLLVFGFYIFVLVILLERMKEDVGWWGITVGDSRRMPAWASSEGWKYGSDPSTRQGDDLDSSLNALADALGISPVQVASAMKPLVPQASLSSVASKSGATGGSEALSMLYGDTKRKDRADTTRIAQEFAERLEGEVAHENVADGGVL